MGVCALGTARTMHLRRRNVFRALPGHQPLARAGATRGHVPRAFQGHLALLEHRNQLRRGHEVQQGTDLMVKGHGCHPEETLGIAPPFGLVHRPLLGHKGGRWRTAQKYTISRSHIRAVVCGDRD